MTRTTRSLAVFLCALMLCVVGHAQDAAPFGVTASLTGTETGTVLRVMFSIAKGHILYAESISVKAAEPARLRPLTVPPSKTKRDPFLEEDVDVVV